MSDYGPSESTPQAELERRIMDSNLPKNEQEWWANREIYKLRERIEALAARVAELEAVLASQRATNAASLSRDMEEQQFAGVTDYWGKFRER